MVDNVRSGNPAHDVSLAHEISSAQTGITVLSSWFTVIVSVSQFAWSSEAVHLGIASLGEDDLSTTPMVIQGRERLVGRGQ